jgi:hypothetical protein
MSVLIAIPVFRISCRVGIDRGRAWSIIDELLLWAVMRQSKTIAALVVEADVPRQLITASIARLMRFRLVEATLREGGVAFRASDYGFKAMSSGDPLPFFPKRIPRRVSFVIDRAIGDFFPTRHVRRLDPEYRLDQERRAGVEVRVVSVDGGGPSMSHEANLRRLSDVAARNWDEQIGSIDSRTATLRDDEFMVLRVSDGTAQGLPNSASKELRRLVAEAAALPRGTTAVPITYAGPREIQEAGPMEHVCGFDNGDVIIGGTAQRVCFENLLIQAHRRVIIHSTFLDAKRFAAMSDVLRAACLRGVQFDLLWGAEKDDETELRNAEAASKIATLVREDPDMRGRIRVHMRTTGSHAKIILVDTAEVGWIAAVGSCNWLSSPFEAVELSIILRDQRAIADVARALQQLAGRRGLSDPIATEMALTANDLRRAAPGSGNASVSVVVGDVHDQLIRRASGAAMRRFVVGSNRLGSTARPGALMQGEVAAGRDGVQAVVLYTQTSGPLKNRHGRALEEEARANGLSLKKTKKKPLHGKFLAWDDDDLVVTSLNWASASADADFVWGDIGVHIHASGVAAHVIARLIEIFPEMVEKQ